MLANLLFSLATLQAAVHGCTASNSLEGGVCKELRQEAPSTLELLQHSVDKAQAAEHAKHQRLTVDQDKGAAHSQPRRQLPDFQDWAATQVIYQGLASILSGSVNHIASLADDFLAQCQTFSESISVNVSTMADEGFDAGVRKLQEIIAADLPSIMKQGTVILEQLLDNDPLMIAGLQNLSLDGTVAAVGKASNTLLEKGTSIGNVEANITAIAVDLDKANKDQKNEALTQLDALATEALGHIATLKGAMVEMVETLLAGLANRIGIQLLLTKASDTPDGVKAEFTAGADAIRQDTEAAATKVSSAQEAVFEGIHKAVYAVQTKSRESGAAAGLGVQLSLSLAVACVVANQQ